MPLRNVSVWVIILRQQYSSIEAGSVDHELKSSIVKNTYGHINICVGTPFQNKKFHTYPPRKGFNVEDIYLTYYSTY